MQAQFAYPPHTHPNSIPLATSIYSTPPTELPHPFPSLSPSTAIVVTVILFTLVYFHVRATHCTTYIHCRSSSLTCSVVLIKHYHSSLTPLYLSFFKVLVLDSLHFTLRQTKQIRDLPLLFLTALVGSNKSKHATTIFTL